MYERDTTCLDQVRQRVQEQKPARRICPWNEGISLIGTI
jgi:hypothetical protein